MGLSRQQLRYMELAKKLSFKSQHPQHFLGAVIVNKHRIVSVGTNTLKTHSKSNTYGRHIHAELAAVIGCSNEELQGATIYIYRRKKSGISGLSKPCPHCEEVLKLAGIKKVCYSGDNDFQEMKL